MSKKLNSLFALLIMVSMILGACAPVEAPAVVTEAPVVVEPTAVPTEVPPTEVPPTEVPPTAVPLDFTALFSTLVDQLPAEQGYGSIGATKLNEALADQAPFLLDVRETADIEKDGFIAGAVHIPLREVLNNLDKLPGLDESIVVYCTSGHRAGTMTAALRILGYTNVKNLGGGMNGWKKAGLAVETGQPAAPTAMSTAIIADQPLYEALNAFYTSMPEGYYALPSATVAENLTASPAPVLVDVRSQAEWDKDGYIEGAVHIPFNDFFKNLDKLPTDLDAPVVVYCGSGHRGAILMMAMRMMGYTEVTNLAGGLGAWKAAQLPVVGWVDWPTVWTEYLAAIPEGYYTVKAADLNTALVETPPFLLDVREAAELEKDGFIAGAVNIPVREVLKSLDKLPALDAPIVIYCASGARGAMAMSALQLLGYTDVKNLAGGLGGWKKVELPVEMGVPAAAVAGTAPEVDATRLRDLDAFLAGLPDGFFTVKAADLNIELTGTPVPAIFDLRTAEEQAAGMIAGAVAVNFQELPANLTLLPAKDQPIVMLCQSGHRGGIATMYLRMVGYTNVRNLAGGMNAWVAAELPVEVK